MKTKRNFAFVVLLFAALLVLSGYSLIQGNGWEAPPEADKLTNPLQNKVEAARSGKKLFSKNCVVCHGNQGEGNGMAAISLHPHPTNLVSPKVEAESDGAIFWKISTGRSPMPGYSSTLSEEKRWQLVSYIRTLQAK
ncbi:c-type cytochrome [Pontibacter sp. MBLB2868]|uniref:c-type cytochrome n=1 Tax=Pontibacter sp. MBLB2868 TaxID=3451555 RepID=UPI003F74D0C0